MFKYTFVILIDLMFNIRTSHTLRNKCNNLLIFYKTVIQIENVFKLCKVEFYLFCKLQD